MEILKISMIAGAITSFGFGAPVMGQDVRPDEPIRTSDEAESRQERLEAHRASLLNGSRVENLQGDRLGTLSDLLVDLETGEVAFVLVQEGFFGVAGELRPVPPGAFEVRATEGVLGLGEGLELVLDVTDTRWEDGPSIARDQIAQLDEETQGREIYDFYGQDWDERQVPRADPRRDRERQPESRVGAATGLTDEPMPHEEREDPAELEVSEASRFHLATDLMDKEIIGRQEEEVGKIDDLLIDLQGGNVTFVVLRPDTGFWGTADEEYAVAPKALQVVDRDRVQLNIERDQLENAQLLNEQNLQQQALAMEGMDAAEAQESPQVFRIEDEDRAEIFGRPRGRQRDPDTSGAEKAPADTRTVPGVDGAR